MNGGTHRMDGETYLEDRLDAQIAWHEAKSSWNQRWYKRLQMVVIAAGAALPFAAGFQSEMPKLAYVVGALGVLVALATGVGALYQFQDLWVKYRLTAEALQQERYRFLTRVAPYGGPDEVAVLVERVEGLLAEQNSQWQGVQAKAAEDG